MKGGALIIGSLLWQDHLWNEDDDIRKNWRKQHLSIKDKIPVSVPIRYGRRSGKGIYTMTYANSTRSKPGTGWIAPFKNYCKSFSELLEEAKAMSKAEGMKGQLIKETENGDVWSIVCLLININKISAKERVFITTSWIKELKKERAYKEFNNKSFRHGSETPSVKANGILNIPWCKAVIKKDWDKLNSYDFLLATATVPTGKAYPTIDNLANGVIADNDREYFKKNRKDSITTFQDQKIINRMIAIMKAKRKR